MNLASISQSYMSHNENERSIVPYIPPAYHPTAPALAVSASQMETMSLGILNQAMSSSAGASGALKDEKAAFGAVAEALRDPEPIRKIKRQVGIQTLKTLKVELSGMRRKKLILKIIMFICANVTMATSLVGGMSIVDEDIAKHLAFDGKEDWVSKTVHGLNLLCTTMLLAANKISEKVREEIARTKRDIAKRQSYVSAATMSWDGDSVTLLRDVKYGD
ncbi:non-structural protein 3 [African horse sickness virus 1]|uniref:Non-structural protein NS3 n=1 Tax=African horse sickness virus 1 TaxID=33714 RepID=A0A1V0CK95_AHSV1|nr:non-structural protein 3 [African horse sickness virus 1]